MELVDAAVSGDRRAIGRLLTLVEDEGAGMAEAMSKLYPLTGKAHVVGVTGPPGVGKSTLVDRLAKEYRNRGLSVGIVAVDPSSPLTGGALLGDRVRMEDLATDPGVFIRSMGTRGSAGGLARRTKDVARVLDACGFRRILVETVGAGQSEVSIMKLAHTTIVMTMPGLGDDIQAIKAGIFEIGNIFVVNKADKEGAERAVADLEAALMMNRQRRTPKATTWLPKVLRTVARSGEGIPELVEATEQHARHLADAGSLRQREFLVAHSELAEIIESEIAKMVLYELRDKTRYDELVGRIVDRRIDPYAAARLVLDEMLVIRKGSRA